VLTLNIQKPKLKNAKIGVYLLVQVPCVTQLVINYVHRMKIVFRAFGLGLRCWEVGNGKFLIERLSVH